MFEQAKIGDEFVFILTGLVSTVTNKTENSIEMFNLAKNKKVGYFDDSDLDEISTYLSTKGIKQNKKGIGIDYTNWYEKTWFERKYRVVD